MTFITVSVTLLQTTSIPFLATLIHQLLATSTWLTTTMSQSLKHQSDMMVLKLTKSNRDFSM